ncbi:MAG: glutathione S-transferase [Cyanobacteria bacterium J06631_12]
MIKAYGFNLSGNSYKVHLLLELLKVDYDWKEMDLVNGEHKSPEYLAVNPLGQVPALVDGETKLTDAQSILVYLAKQYGGEQWLPTETLPMVQVINWLFTTAGEVRQGPESARLYHFFGVSNINVERTYQKSEHVLTYLNQHLSTRTWLEFERPTIADVAVFPYVALSRDGKINLDDYPHILTWIDRVKKLPGFISMPGL